MDIAALRPKPRTTKPASGHKFFPYLQRNLVIDKPSQVWAADITYRAPRPEISGILVDLDQIAPRSDREEVFKSRSKKLLSRWNRM